MRKVKFLIPVIIVVLIAGIAASSGVYRRDLSTKNQSYADLDLVEDVVELIETNYVDKKSLDFKKLAYGALRGMVSTLDHYSQFLDPDEYKDIKVETKGEFGGVDGRKRGPVGTGDAGSCRRDIEVGNGIG